MLDIKPLHSSVWDCSEDTVVSIATWLKKDYRLMFAESWGFKLHPPKDDSQQILGARIQAEKGDMIALLKKYHGIHIEQYVKTTASEGLDVICKEIKEHRPVAICVDLYHCPWSDFYRKVHSYHVLVAAGMDVENDNLKCVDPTILKSEVTLPIQKFKEGYYGCATVSLTKSEETEVDWKAILSKAITRLKDDTKQQNLFDEMRTFAEEMGRSLDMHKEIKGYEDHDYDAPLLKRLLEISRGRMSFAMTLKYLEEVYGINELSNFIKRLEQVGWHWQSLRMALMKACHVNKGSLNSADIANKIKGLAGEEEAIADGLANVCVNSFVMSDLFDFDDDILEGEPEKTGEMVFVDLSSYTDNKGFTLDIAKETSSGFHGNQYFYLAEQLPADRIWNVNNEMTFLFPDLQGGKEDNVTCQGQSIEVPQGRYSDVMVLGSCEEGSYLEKMHIVYADGTQQEVPLEFSDWRESQPFFGETVAWTGDCSQKEDGTQRTRYKAHLYAKKYKLESSQTVIAIRLPQWPHIHLFAISFLQKAD